MTSNGGELHLTKSLVEFAKADVAAQHQAQIAASHKIAENKVNFTSDTMNCDSGVDLDRVKELHAETYKTNMPTIEARALRLQNGKGNIEDLSAKYNSLKA